MMMNSKKQLSELLSAMHFPRKGEALDNTKVLASSAVLENDILKYEVVFPKGTKTKQVPTLLKKFFSMQVIPSQDNLVVRHHDYTVKPKAGNVAVVGAMHIPPVVRANPSIQDFDQDYSKMEMTNPETYFRKHDTAPLNSPQFRAKMFTFVSMMGENYGYGTDKHIFHRRASLIMPKIKITKAVPQAKMMYHTHPRKDEPSLSSPDDYLLYMDLSHKPRSIRHFYTVMADRMDYFTVKPKNNSKENYVKLNEDKILKELTDEMDDIEAKWDKKTPKTGDYQDDLRFCENITRDFVKWLNKRYSKYFTITYKCYYKVKKNPPEPEIEDLHLGDEMLEKSLDSIKSRDYTWTPSVKSRAHEDSAYWHQVRHLDTLGNSAKTLGISPQGSMKRAYDTYMNKAFEESKFSYYDALNILNLAHDISSADSKIRDGGELSSRLSDMCSYLELDEKSTETLLFLEEVIHNENLFTEEANTMCGDFYGLALLSSYAIQAVGAIGLVKEGKKDYTIVEYEIYSALKEETQKRFEEFLLGEKDHRGYAMGENAPASRGFVDSFLNPPTVISKRADFEHIFPPEAFAYDFDLVKEALDEFNVEKYEPTKNFFVRGQLYLRFPVTSGKVSMSIATSTGKAQIFVTRRPDPMEDALDAVTKVGTALVRYGLPGIDPEEYDVKAIDAAQNPQTSQVIAISGPSGVGKSTTIRNLLKLLPNSKTAPTLTTRQKRKSDKPGERVFLSADKFKKQMKEGKLVAAGMQKNKNYYGRRKSDFKGADYVIIDVNPSGINAIKQAYPNTFTVYLEPVEDPAFILKRLIRRGDMSPQEARGRAAIIPAHIKGSKHIDFDMRVKTKQGEFAKIALEIEPMIPKQNPSLGELVREVYEEEEEGLSIKPSGEADVVIHGDVINAINSNVHVGDALSDRSHKAERDIISGSVRGDILSGKSRKAGENLLGDGSIINNPSIREWISNVFSKGTPPITWDRSKRMGGLEVTEDLEVVDVPIADIEEAFQKDKGYYVPTMTTPKGKVERIAQAAAKGIPLPVPMGGFVNGIFSFIDGRHRYSYTRDFTNDTTIPIAKWKDSPEEESQTLCSICYDAIHYHLMANKNDKYGLNPYIAASRSGPFPTPDYNKYAIEIGDEIQPHACDTDFLEGYKGVSPCICACDNKLPNPPNPSKKPKAIRIEESPNKEKKLVAYFYDKDGKKFRTVHFGARGMSDFTQHKDPKRMKRYLARHKGMGENWKDPMTAGALSRWILWGKPSLRESFNDFKKRFNLEGVMAVTNTRMNPHHCPIEAEALRAASDPSFKHHEWYIEHHLNYVMAIAKAIVKSDEPEDQQLIHDMVWMHDYPKMMGDNDNFELVRALVSKHRDERYTDRLMNQLRWMEEIKSPDWSGKTTTIAAVMSTADALAHYYGPFWQIYMDENPDTPIEELKQSNAAKLEKDKRKLRAGPMEDGLDSVKLQYKGRKVRVVGNEHIAKLIERKNPRIPKKYEGQDPSEHSDLYTDEDPKGTIQGLGFKDKATAERSVNIIKRSGKTHAHKIQAAMAMEQRARFHPNATPGIKAAQKVYANFIEEMKEKTKRNPKKTPEGRKIPKRYLKGLNKEEMLIAAKEIDKGYKYDISDPKAYEYWKSDIQATARGYKTVPSKYKKKFIKMYGPLPEKGKFLDKMAKATKIKKSILQKVYDKGLAAWRGGHRPGVQQHQWAAGRVYSFVTLGNTVKKGGKKMPDHSLAVKAGLIKENPPLYIHSDKAEKWSERYEKITAMTGEELLDLANKLAEEKGLTVELETHKQDTEKLQKRRRDFPLPPKYEKLYQKFLESKTGVDIRLYRGNTLVDELNFGLIEESTKELFEYLKQRKRLPPNRALLPFVCQVRQPKGEKRYLNFRTFFVTAATQPKNRFPISIGGGGGFGMSEGQQGKGYYGIIKTYQAGFLEANNIEAFGDGMSPMRVDMYQSYGWLSAYSYKDNYPYPSRAAEYYLNLHGTTKKPNKDAEYFSVYRPVYSRKMTGAAYRAGVKKMLGAATNPPEWRHGEFAEEDPFEEYF